ncbi:aspartate--tRNA(Asn) ligase [Clostridium manihotivorum]|uniref:Aspartate--tRNA ligase n=1 Tax=Clostridium manihotivorum TaxID=2320868 RepID=A0A3R5VC15_9CLOT|nr:aspartate--tRNA(Asn) ligase [Clostridium manihotivorum]QAA34964.1 aspartate--tRNA(Asn) ligase [Clostridium manihotivorum]
MERTLINELKCGSKVKITGWLHKVRSLSKVSFLVLRDRSGMVQCVVDNNQLDIQGIKLESVLAIWGNVVEGKNKISNIELQAEKVEVITLVKDELPITINKSPMESNLETQLNNRVLSLRNEDNNFIFKIQAAISQGFSEFLIKEGFTQIYTPKLVSEGAEGGTALFKVNYFEKQAYLAQSPQTYKQMMVAAGYERVFEIGHVYRAEEHNTSRHINEYVSMDLEMGFIEDEQQLIELETELLKFILCKIENEYKGKFEELGIIIPQIREAIPQITLQEAIEILKAKYCRSDLVGDLDPLGEKQIYQYAKEELDSEFIFITNYPRSKRPMYTMPKGELGTRSFDLLFRGVEITTGGQRINEYSELVENMKYKGLNPEDFGFYLESFKYGMPPHGGLAIGLERITAQLLQLNNIREATLFPRDRTRLTP